VVVVSVSFIGRGNRSAKIKLPTCRKLLTNFVVSSTPRLNWIQTHNVVAGAAIIVELSEWDASINLTIYQVHVGKTQYANLKRKIFSL
jgi:hypothetical protein